MKKISLLGLVLLFTNFLIAQDAQKAKALLNEVSAKIKGYENIFIDFNYTLNNTKERINQESKGNVTIKGNLYYLEFMGVTKIYDGKSTYNIVPEDEEITISSVEENDENAITPDKMLTFFNKGYNYAWDILQNVKGRKIQYIKLIPISAKDTRKEILLGIDAQTKHIYNMIEVDKNGTRTTLTVNSFKTNQPLSKNHFTFDANKYADYYINRID
uniref:LolA family protein n=1 Tax=Flavobacterium sp. TaxID=239 RepID=UPI004048FBF0